MRPVPGTGLQRRAAIGLCSFILIVKKKPLTESSRYMVSFAASYPRKVLLDGKFYIASVVLKIRSLREKFFVSANISSTG